MKRVISAIFSSILFVFILNCGFAQVPFSQPQTVGASHSQQLQQSLQQEIVNLNAQLQVLNVQNIRLQAAVQAMSAMTVQPVVRTPNFTLLMGRKLQSLSVCNNQNCTFQQRIHYFPVQLMMSLEQDYSVARQEENRYLAICFLGLVIFVLIIVLGSIFLYYRSHEHKTEVNPKKYPLDLSDDTMAKVSGEDIMASKLDLARAYIDMHDYSSAKRILENVCAEGASSYQVEAKRLLEEIKGASH